MQTVHHNHLMQTVRFLLIGTLLTYLGLNLLGCSPIRPTTSPVYPLTYEVLGTQSERVQVITTIIANHKQPPSALLNAYFIEEKLGDDFMGPADYRSFYRIEISTNDMSKWQEGFTLLDAIPSYPIPEHATEWWIKEEEFAALEFYAADQLTGRNNSWMGISPQQGLIFIFSFTT